MTGTPRSLLLAFTAAALFPPASSSAAILPLIWDDCPESSRGQGQAGARKVRVPLVSPYAVEEMMKRGQGMELVDVRPAAQFDNEHLAGARSLPPESLRGAPMPPERATVLYCAVCCCPEITEAARALLERGATDVRVLRAGLEEIGELILWKSPDSTLDEPDNLIQLPCGRARAAVKNLTRRILRDDIAPIEFELDSAVLRHFSGAALGAIVDILSRYPSVRLEVQGHTCDLGGTDYNLRLSRRRAAAVRRHLLEAGVSPAAIISKGFGAGRPVAPNRTEAGRRLNRRVELHWRLGNR